MLSQQHNQVNNKGANGEARCFLCLKDTLDEYTFQFEDFCNFIIKKKIYCKRDPKKIKNEKELSENLYNSLKDESKKLIKPCKCDILCHIQCLIQYCIMHLIIKCDECNCEYCFDFKDLNENSNSSCFYISMVLWIILHVVLLTFAILFFVLDIIPKKYEAYNYIIAIILVLVNCLLIYGNILNYKPNKNLHQNIYPSFIQYSSGLKKTDEEYTNFSCFLQRALKSTMFEIVEKKVYNRLYLTTTLNTQREINEYINTNNNELFDTNSEEIKEKMKEEELEDKFHGAQIIKSSLVENDKVDLQEHNNNHNNNNNNNNKVINKMFPKSRTKNAHMRYSQNIPKGKNNSKVNNHKSNFEKMSNNNNDDTKRNNDTNEYNMNSRANLNDDILNMNIKKKEINGKNSDDENKK